MNLLQAASGNDGSGCLVLSAMSHCPFHTGPALASIYFQGHLPHPSQVPRVSLLSPIPSGLLCSVFLWPKLCFENWILFWKSRSFSWLYLCCYFNCWHARGWTWGLACSRQLLYYWAMSLTSWAWYICLFSNMSCCVAQAGFRLCILWPQVLS